MKIHSKRKALKLFAERIHAHGDFGDEGKTIGLIDCSKKLRNDKEVVLTAVKQLGFELAYASEELRGDREVVLEAVGHLNMLRKNFETIEKLSWKQLKKMVGTLNMLRKNFEGIESLFWN